MSEITYDYTDLYWQHRRGSDLFGGLAMLAMMACVINCALPELEMLLTGGNVPIPNGIIKIGCFAFLIALMILYRTFDLTSFPTISWVAVIVYLALVFPFLWFVARKEPSEILLAYNAYYCPLIFAPVVAAFRGRLSERTALRIFLAVF